MTDNRTVQYIYGFEAGYNAGFDDGVKKCLQILGYLDLPHDTVENILEWIDEYKEDNNENN